ncbi:MAG TPA: DNA gyrase inhibitor YacG [Terriglobia bacterium]|nr:DNA gyrase inhibitor YacG [Terriglobia bacterium]
MRCPICKRETTWEGNPWRPFCGERCRLIDLDNWLAGRYRISSPAGESESEERQDSAGSEVGERDGNGGH